MKQIQLSCPQCGEMGNKIFRSEALNAKVQPYLNECAYKCAKLLRSDEHPALLRNKVVPLGRSSSSVTVASTATTPQHSSPANTSLTLSTFFGSQTSSWSLKKIMS